MKPVGALIYIKCTQFVNIFSANISTCHFCEMLNECLIKKKVGGLPATGSISTRSPEVYVTDGGFQGGKGGRRGDVQAVLTQVCWHESLCFTCSGAKLLRSEC